MVKCFVLLSLLVPAAALVSDSVYVSPDGDEENKFDFKSLMAKAKGSQVTAGGGAAGVAGPRPLPKRKPWAPPAPEHRAPPPPPVAAAPEPLPPPIVRQNGFGLENAEDAPRVRAESTWDDVEEAPQPVESQAAAAKRRLAEQFAAKAAENDAAPPKRTRVKVGAVGGMDFTKMLENSLAGGPPPMGLRLGPAKGVPREAALGAEEPEVAPLTDTPRRAAGPGGRRKPTPRRAAMKQVMTEAAIAAVAEEKVGRVQATDGDYPVNRLSVNDLSDDSDDGKSSGGSPSERDSFSSDASKRSTMSSRRERARGAVGSAFEATPEYDSDNEDDDDDDGTAFDVDAQADAMMDAWDSPPIFAPLVTAQRIGQHHAKTVDRI